MTRSDEDWIELGTTADRPRHPHTEQPLAVQRLDDGSDSCPCRSPCSACSSATAATLFAPPSRSLVGSTPVVLVISTSLRQRRNPNTLSLARSGE
jgi:hypothetical protein